MWSAGGVYTHYSTKRVYTHYSTKKVYAHHSLKTSCIESTALCQKVVKRVVGVYRKSKNAGKIKHRVYAHYSSPAPKKSESHRTSRRWVYMPAARPPSPQPSTLSSPLPAGPTDPVQHISRPPACLVPAAWETIQTVGRCTSIRRATGHSILELWNWKLVCIQIESYVSEIVCATTLEIISIITYFGDVFSDSEPLGKKNMLRSLCIKIATPSWEPLGPLGGWLAST